MPTEAEWEYASRGLLSGARYPWGDELLDPAGQWQTNIWQGRFPTSNDLDDGHLTTAPVRSFAANSFGLWQTVGNVWEWCADLWNTSSMSARTDGAAWTLRGRSNSASRVHGRRHASVRSHTSSSPSIRSAGGSTRSRLSARNPSRS
ncbi:SUMF1/EgtB/PvdO family nonheme iron enzyme [Micromonospora citrea]|uniref:SUMF1/EgtB/PvdO family nonheme iron enzyme n=1 Tax=Micromonospora citrea TaxID=47855 RepID=UPI003C6A5CB7